MPLKLVTHQVFCSIKTQCYPCICFKYVLLRFNTFHDIMGIYYNTGNPQLSTVIIMTHITDSNQEPIITRNINQHLTGSGNFRSVEISPKKYQRKLAEIEQSFISKHISENAPNSYKLISTSLCLLSADRSSLSKILLQQVMRIEQTA